jgi:hypothetical protein
MQLWEPVVGTVVAFTSMPAALGQALTQTGTPSHPQRVSSNRQLESSYCA